LKEFIESDNSVKLVAFYSAKNDKELETLNDLLQNSYFTMLDIRKVALCSENCPNEYNGQVIFFPLNIAFNIFLVFLKTFTCVV